MDARLNAIEEDNRFIKQGIINLSARMEAIEKIIEESMRSTVPALERLENKVDSIQTEIRDINYKIRTLNHHVLDLAGKQRHIEDRVDNLERQLS